MIKKHYWYRHWLSLVILTGIIIVLVVGLPLLLETRPLSSASGTPPSKPPRLAQFSSSPVQPEVPSNTQTAYPYPPPAPTQTKSPNTQSPGLALAVARLSLPGNITSAVYGNGNIWLVKPGRDPQALTEFDDVEMIFGWNRSGTRLLFGRGRYPVYMGAATELWMLDLPSGKAHLVTESHQILAAAWSPVDDIIAYCEWEGGLLSIVNMQGQMQGQLLHQRDGVGCDFVWSPDGSAIAFGYFTPEMIQSDGLATSVLAVWWLADERLQVFSKAVDEVQYQPVWSIDGQRILFERTAPWEKRELSGLYVVDVVSGNMIRVHDLFQSAGVMELRRSPYADVVAFRMGSRPIYVMDFKGHIEEVGWGEGAIWLPGGNSLIYHPKSGGLKVVSIDKINSLGKPVGGGSASGMDLPPGIVFYLEDTP